MFNRYGGHGFLGKCILPLAVHIDQSFSYEKMPIRDVHSSIQYKQTRPNGKIPRKFKTCGKPTSNKVADPKVYMREIVKQVSNILRYSSWDYAREQLETLPIKWDSYTINQVLKTHPPMEKAWLFFNWASLLKGFKHDQFTYTTMLDIFGEAGRISSMNYLYQQMPKKGLKVDTVTYTSLLHWLSKDGNIDGSVKTWKEMRAKGCLPTVVTYTAYMKVLLDHNRVKEATDIYKEMLEVGCSPNCHTYTVLMEYLSGSGKYNEALEIFGKMQEVGTPPDKAACNILIEKCCKEGETRPMTQILLYMKENRVVLRFPVYLKALKAFQAAGESDSLLGEVNPHISLTQCKEEVVESKEGSVDDIDRGIVSSFIRRGNFAAVDAMLMGLTHKSAHLNPTDISAIVNMNCVHCRIEGALLALEYGTKTSIRVEKTSYLALVGVLMRGSSFLKAVELIAAMVGAGHSLGTHQAAVLIYRFASARRSDLAAKVFNLLPRDQKNSATYTALICAYFFMGDLEEALKIYGTMRDEGIPPTLGTYNVLIAGLLKGGKLLEAGTYKKERKSFIASSNCLKNALSLAERICDLLFNDSVVI